MRVLYMRKEIDFIETLNSISESLKQVKYDNGDLSDIGNEIGYTLGKTLPNLTEEEIKIFIFGVKHGISLTNGTH